LEEKQLIELCLQHDRNSQKMLYERYSRQMMSICMRYCKDEFLAQEAVQNGFIKVFNNLISFNNTLPFGPWIRRIMINCSLDQLAKNARTVPIEDGMANLFSTSNTINEELTMEEMMKLVETMPPGYRTVFNMYIIDDFSHQEIAETLNISEATSRSQLFKARNYLKMALTNNQNLYL